MTAPAPASNYSCLLPPSFTGLTDVEDFITQIEAVASLSNWSTLNPDPRPHFFSARLTGGALTFYRSLTPAQKGSFDEIKRLFWRQYKPKAVIAKAQVKICVNYRDKTFPPSTGQYEILPVRHIMMMQCVMKLFSPIL